MDPTSTTKVSLTTPGRWSQVRCTLYPIGYISLTSPAEPSGRPVAIALDTVSCHPIDVLYGLTK